MCEKCGLTEKQIRLALQASQSLIDLHHCILDDCEKLIKQRKNEEKVRKMLKVSERVGASIDLLQLAFPGLSETDDDKLAGEIVGCEGKE